MSRVHCWQCEDLGRANVQVLLGRILGAQPLPSSAASRSRELSFPRFLRMGTWKQLAWVLLATSLSHEVAVKMLADCAACRLDS